MLRWSLPQNTANYSSNYWNQRFTQQWITQPCWLQHSPSLYEELLMSTRRVLRILPSYVWTKLCQIPTRHSDANTSCYIKNIGKTNVHVGNSQTWGPIWHVLLPDSTCTRGRHQMNMRRPELGNVVPQAKCVSVTVLLEHSKGLINVNH